MYQAVDIFAIPANPTLQDAVALCNGPVTLEAWPVDTAAFFYTWSTGATTRTITVDEPNLITVFITNTDGCQSDPRESFIADARPNVFLGVPQTICELGVLPDLDALNPGSAYEWSVNGVANGNTTRIQSIDSSVPGPFVYSIRIEDIFNCVATDSVLYTIANAPIYTALGNATNGCGLDDGSIGIDLTEAGSFTYQITGPTNVGVSTLTGPANLNVPSPGILAPGGYTVNLVNTLTGCESSLVATVEDNGALFTIDTPVPAPACEGLGVLAFNLAGTAPGNVTYDLLDSFGAIVTSGTATPNPITISGLDPGTYSISIQEVGGSNCVQTFDDIVLDGLPIADFSVTPQNICGTDGVVRIFPITVDSDIDYSWSGPGGNGISDSLLVTSAGDYTVISSGTGFCQQTSVVTVAQNDNPEVVIDTQGDSCDGLVTLVANVNNGLIGNGAYQWDDGSIASQRSVNTSGTYQVLVLDQGSGCTGTGTLDVDVFNEITVFIAAAPNCDANGEVFLSAFSNITEDVTFEWTDPTGDLLSDTGAEISISLGGNYQIRVASTLSICEANANIEALVLPIAAEELLLRDDELFCSQDTDPANSSVVLDPGAFSTYEWTILNDDEVLSTTRELTVSEGGIYEVTLSNGFTCVRDQVDVRDDCSPLVHAPNAFTPNGNGVNDEYFVYPNPYVSDFNIEIYSRWGELVFQSNDIDFRWNGFYLGHLLQVDMYVYVMRFRSSLEPQLGVIEQRGGVALLK
jgi:gliding motility-associated-like protein